MDENNHLPLYGIGPYVIGFISLIALTSIALSYFKLIPNYSLNQLQ